MQVFLAEHYGFCYGVKRAVDLALMTKKDNPVSPVYTLGPIIHNPQMVKHLSEKGIDVAETIDSIPVGGTVIIRSHGVGPDIYKKAEKLKVNVVDATCPHVKKAQMAAFELAQNGYQVVIIGERHHPEVKGIFQWANEQAVNKKAIMVETLEDAHKISRHDRLGVVVQTTFSTKNFQEILKILNTKCDNLKVERTICTSTDKRQEAALTLAGKVDIMIVVGGKNSANTARLAQTTRNAGCQTFHIETAQEIQTDWFVNAAKIGITAGASTPDWIVMEVYDKIKRQKE